MPITRLLRGAGAVAQLGEALLCVGLELEPDIAARQFQRCDATDKQLPMLDQAVLEGCRGLVSFGLSRGLSPELGSGDIIVASHVVGDGQVFPTDDAWSACLLSAIPEASYAPIVGVDAAALARAERDDLGLRSGAVAVDIESHTIAGFAAMHSLRFVSLRVIIDAAHRNVPELALAAVSSDGATGIRRLPRQLMGRPAGMIDVLRLWADWVWARRALKTCCEALGTSAGEIGF